MKKTMILGAVLILIAAGAAFGRSYNLDEKADVNLSGVDEVVFDLRGPSCAMCVRTMDILSEISGDGSGRSMSLNLEGDITSNRDKAVPSLNVEEGGRRVTIRLYPERKTYFGLNQGGNAVFTAILPESFNGRVSVTGASDDIYVHDFGLEALEVKSSSGDLDAETVTAAEISLELSSGDMRGDRLTAAGSLKVDSSSGKLDLGVLEADDMDIEASSGDITIVSATAGSRFRVKASSGRINITELDTDEGVINSSSGRITVDTSRSASLSIDASSGDINLGTVESDNVTIELSSGDLGIDTLTAGKTEVKTSGDTTVMELTGEFRLDGSSGKVDLSFTAAEAPIDLDVSSGDITLTLPEGSAFDVDFRTSSGKVRSDFAILGDLSNDNDGMNGTVNGGGVMLKAETSSGDIRLQSR